MADIVSEKGCEPPRSEKNVSGHTNERFFPVDNVRIVRKRVSEIGCAGKWRKEVFSQRKLLIKVNFALSVPGGDVCCDNNGDATQNDGVKESVLVRQITLWYGAKK